MSRFMSQVSEQKVEAAQDYIAERLHDSQGNKIPLSDLTNETMQDVMFGYRTLVSEWKLRGDKAEARAELAEAEHEKTTLELKVAEGYLTNAPVNADEHKRESERIQNRINAAQERVSDLSMSSALRDSE